MGMDPNRIIHIEGDGLLPPAYEPQIPADIKEDERVRVIPPSPPWRAVTSDDIILKMSGKSPQDQRYWFFHEAFERKLPPYEWEGNPRYVTGIKLYGTGEGLDHVPDGTIFRFNTKKTGIALPDLWSGFGLMIMEQRLLDLFIANDPDAIAYRSVSFQNNSGDIISNDYSIVDVVRNIPAVDIANSIVDYRGPQSGYPAFLAKYVSIRIRSDLDPAIHVFRQQGFAGSGNGQVIVSNEFRTRLEEIRPAFKNIRFAACGDLK